MSAELAAIRASYEDLGMTPEEIAEDRGLQLEAVQAGLLQCSPKYRKVVVRDTPEGDKSDISDEQLKRVTDVILDIALSSEDDGLRLKAAMYIRDDKKGRRDAVKAVSNVQNNIFQINNAIRNAREGALKLKQAVLA